MKKAWKGFLLSLCLLAFVFCSADAANGDFVIENGILVEYHGPGGAVVIPDGVTTIGGGVFHDNDTITSVVLPKGLTSLLIGSFERCKNLSSVTLPEGLLELETVAFGGCESLETITIPDSVQVIGYAAFAGCSSLRSVYLPSTVKVDSSAFESTPWDKANTTVIREGMRGRDVIYRTVEPSTATVQQGDFLLRGPVLIAYQGNGGRITIPEGVTAIGEKAFFQNTTITSVQVPASLRTIGASAFEGCTALTTISPLPDGFRYIAERAFYGCTSLTGFDKPDGVSIAHDATTGGCTVFTGTRFEQPLASLPLLENRIIFSKNVFQLHFENHGKAVTADTPMLMDHTIHPRFGRGITSEFWQGDSGGLFCKKNL